RAFGPASGCGVLNGGDRARAGPVGPRRTDAPVPRAPPIAPCLRRRYLPGSARMIHHTQYRKAVMADPHSEDSELQAHREICAECRAYTERLLKFESRLGRAVGVEVPAGRP